MITEKNRQSVSVVLPPELMARVVGIKREIGCPIGETLRRALVEYLDRHHPEAKQPTR